MWTSRGPRWLAADLPLSRSPRNVISPSPAGSSPLSTRRSVVLPWPFGPVRTTNLPSSTEMLTSSSTVAAP